MCRLTTVSTLLTSASLALVLFACGGNSRGRGGGDDPPPPNDAGGCVPMCEGLNCGPDGCGGSCGPCEGICVEGICGPGEGCVSSCSEQECGFDGCGGSCGECEAVPGATCIDNRCQLTACEPQCGGNECGSDSCGGSCGTCSGGESCNEGTCQGGTSSSCESGDCACACERAEVICGSDPSDILGADCFTSCRELSEAPQAYLFSCTNSASACDRLLECAQQAFAMDTGVGPGSLCTETCRYSNDGDCDDGGHGSDFSGCELGTDCLDCGPRSDE